MLALTHLSAVTSGPTWWRRRQLFPETVVPRDFDVIEIPFAERGAPASDPEGCTTRAAGVGSST